MYKVKKLSNQLKMHARFQKPSQNTQVTILVLFFIQ